MSSAGLPSLVFCSSTRTVASRRAHIGFDPVAAYELRILVEKVVQQTGAACIWATHDLHFLPPKAKRVVLLRDGRVIFDGATSEGLSTEWLQRAGLLPPQDG